MPIACLGWSDWVQFGARESVQSPTISTSFELVKRQKTVVRSRSPEAPWASFKSCQPDWYIGLSGATFRVRIGQRAVIVLQGCFWNMPLLG